LASAWVLDLIGLVSSLAFLSFSSWKDVTTREVTDRVWLLSYPVGLMLLATRFFTQTDSWLPIVVSLAAAFAISIVWPYLGLWGGADSKAFLCLAIMNPLIPSLDSRMPHIVDPFFPLVVFCNAYVASLASVLYAILRNLRTRPLHTLFDGLQGENRFRKLAAFLTGYRIPVDELQSKSFLFPLETVRRQGSTFTRHFKFELDVNADPQKELTQIIAARDSGLLHDTVWVSPGLPFLLFMTAGLALTLAVGDMVWYVVSAVLSFAGAAG
jgi:preflagellin peptidase FlaK